MKTSELSLKRPRKNCASRSVAGIPAYASAIALPRSQRGVVLILTLIVLVAMTLAAIALVRSVDTGNMLAGNMAFKQGATNAGDAGTEAGIAYLRTGGTSGVALAGSAESYVDIPAQGYYATAQNLDMTGNSQDPTRGLVDWDSNNCNSAPASACVRPAPSVTNATGNTVTFIINRLCSQAGATNNAGNDCVTFLAQGGQSPRRSELKYGLDRRFSLVPVEFYRITSRVTGPRHTVSYVEAVVHF